MPTLLLQGRSAAEKEAFLRKELDEAWRILVWDPGKDEPDAFTPLALQADAIVGGKFPVATWPALPRLRAVQITWTGFDSLNPADFPSGVPVCNCYGHEAAIAEYVLLAMLEWKIGLRHMDRRFREEGWGGRGPTTGFLHGELEGATLGILGYGPIGREVAKRARAFQMRVLGIRRQKQALPPELDWLGGLEHLDELLAASDFVVVACALNDQTRGLIDKARLAKMKPDGVLINIARGEVVEEAALFEALKERRIGGAVIDVWYNYVQPDKPDVWPANFPFQDLNNVILSAHECGLTENQSLRRWRFIAENLGRLAEGRALENVIFTGAG